MIKLSSLDKKQVNAGAASIMGIATGLVTAVSLTGLIADLISRYWGGKSRQSTGKIECPIGHSNYLSSNFEFWDLPETQSNRITIYTANDKPYRFIP